MQQILIIDDDPGIVGAVTAALEDAGYGVRSELGPYALIAAEQLPTHLILLDMLMPYMSGPCMLEYLTTCPATRHIPVVVMSALGAADAAIRGAGGAAQLAKPFDLDDLLGTVAARALPDHDDPAAAEEPAR